MPKRSSTHRLGRMQIHVGDADEFDGAEDVVMVQSYIPVEKVGQLHKVPEPECLLNAQLLPNAL
jgi:hypothetical protein